jgi:hypothetical protein
MALITTNNGEVILLEWMLVEEAFTDPVKLKLFSNNYTPVATSAVGDFTEATFTGYTEKTLDRDTWNAPSSSGGKGTITYPEQTWTAGSSQTIYGYYITNNAEDEVLWAEKFASARALASSDVLNLTVRLTLNAE